MLENNPTCAIVISPEDLEAFTRPALDLQTGQIVELAPPAEPPVQLELPFGAAPAMTLQQTAPVL